MPSVLAQARRGRFAALDPPFQSKWRATEKREVDVTAFEPTYTAHPTCPPFSTRVTLPRKFLLILTNFEL
jgi:hypothetical protein